MNATDRDDSQTVHDNSSNCLKLIFKSKIFFIPRSFSNLPDVDRNIYDELTKTNRYVIKSNVNDKIFISFLNHWIFGLIPNINIDNIQEYELLSQEFDRMKNLIQIFKRFNPKFEISYLIENNQKYKKKIKKKMNFIQIKKQKFLQVIDCRFENDFSRISKSKGIRKDFSNFLMKYDFFDKKFKLNFLLEDKLFQIHKLFKKEAIEAHLCNFSINRNNKTADLYNGFDLHGEKVIPTSIKCEDKDYFITNILENSFSSNLDLISISFEKNSHLEKICENSFSFSKIIKISFPPSLKIINAKAFYNCDYLESVTFPDNSQIKYIGKKAFSDTIISSISISSVNDLFIDDEAFSDCTKLENAEFKKLHSIGRNVFKGSLIKSIVIPSDIIAFKSRWILETRDLKEVKIHQKDIVNIQWYKNDFIFGKSDPLSSEFDALLYARKDIETVEIPSFIKRIDSSAFNQCRNIKKVIFEADSKLISIGDYAFYKSSLESITIPASVTDIERSAFSNCTNLKTVIFEDNSKLQLIGSHAFAGTKITRISIPSTVSVMNESPFLSSELKNLDLSKNMKLRVIEKRFLTLSNIEKVIFPSSVVEFKRDWCILTEKLNQVEFGDENPNFTTINDGKLIVGQTDFMSNDYDNLLFASRNIENVSIPSFIKRIGHYAFDDCKNLRTLEFPRNSELTTIEKMAFYGSGIVSVTLPSSLIHLNSNCFGNSKLQKVDFYDPKSSKLISIGDHSFCSTSLKSITIPPNLELIGNTALGFSSLKIVTFPKDSKLKILSKNAFEGTPLQRIYLPASLIKIKSKAFTFCKMIEQVHFDDNSQLEVIGSDAFSFSSLKAISIPHRISVIKERAFSFCHNLFLIEISDHSFLTSLNHYAFSSGENLSIFIPKGSILEKMRKKW
ncbi:hypothetical protein M9Y10_021349 [Tritrichomonas musculus]|uniref:Surface antigen BspA-like n=1 Tax=Tritrichomonas musculus TaxID=1915356 RepID=A0ABR2HDP7_9EUKA